MVAGTRPRHVLCFFAKLMRRYGFRPRVACLPLLLLLHYVTAEARTLPHTGAIALSSTFSIQSPFPCGTKIRISCGYGPRCSPAHKRINSKTSTNEFYAVDFVRAEPKNGYGKAIVAVAAGVVRFAGWTRRGWAPYGQMVYIDHDFRDQKGRSYQTLYAHLSRVLVKKDQWVQAGTIIGTLGGSSKGKLHRFGPHLHFAMYQGARKNLGGGRAVVPEPLGQYEDLRRGQQMVACGRPAPELFGARQPARDNAFGGLIDVP